MYRVKLSDWGDTACLLVLAFRKVSMAFGEEE